VAQTRRRIIEAAASEFRGKGIDATGLAELMSAAGLTHGGFYKHFDSKDQVVEESVAHAAHSLANSLQSKLSSSSARALQAAIDDYLSAEHRDNARDGCPFVALGSEITRGNKPLREAATVGFLRLVDAIAAQLKNMPPAAARKKALVMLSTMIGALTMARVVTDPDLSDSILRQARKDLSRRGARLTGATRSGQSARRESRT